MDNNRMDWEFGSATNGNIAIIGEINLGAPGEDGSREFTLAIGIGEGHHTAAAEDHRLSRHALSQSIATASSSSGTASPIPSGSRPNPATAAS